jgi:voltage-gated potassium channel
VNCLGIKNQEGKFIINPSPETIIRERMKIMLFGTMHQIDEMKIHFTRNAGSGRA